MSSSVVPPAKAPFDRIPITDCTLARAVDVVGDRWLLLVLREALLFGTTRFETFREALGVSRAVLADRLNRAESEGLLHRVPYAEPGRRERHEYRPTRKAAALAPALAALMAWGDRYACDGTPPLALSDAETGLRVRVAFVTESGAVLDDSTRLRGRRVGPPSTKETSTGETATTG